MAFRKSAGISQIENALFFSHLGRREGMLNLRRSDIEESSAEALENEIVGDEGRGWTWQSSYKLLFERINSWALHFRVLPLHLSFEWGFRPLQTVQVLI